MDNHKIFLIRGFQDLRFKVEVFIFQLNLEFLDDYQKCIDLCFLGTIPTPFQTVALCILILGQLENFPARN